ncbi:hypothetical protein [Pedobacter borealis]|uniref:hypothetical protein n=1 Tax=Pedobacter borealis TaxID=475254 RepID=UPI0004930D29|nr:hypothetical protein [Pedobacter borealis]
MRASTLYMGVIVPAVILLPMSVAIYKRKLWNLTEKIFFYYLLIAALFNAIAIVTGANGINNLPFLHLYTVIEFCILCAVFRSFFSGQPVRKLLAALMILFPLMAINYIGYTNSLFFFNVLPRFLSSLILLLFCVYFLIFNLSTTESSSSIFNLTIVIALLLYFSSSSIFFALIEYVQKNKELNRLLWIIHATLVLLMYLIFTKAYLTIKKSK